MTPEHAKEITGQHNELEAKKAEKERIAERYKKLNKSQCSDDYSVRLKGEKK